MRALWSSRCLVCRSTLTGNSAVCQRCMYYLQAPENVCLNCGLGLPADEGAGTLICGHCLKSPPPFPQLTACCPWNEVVQILVHRLKYGRELVCARVFGSLFRLCMSGQNPARLPALVPVPLSRRRLYARGFNQAEEIARWCQHYGVGRLVDAGARRRRHTAAQSQLQPGQRRANVRNCFHINPGARAGTRDVIILDDVVTTTSTVAELTRALLRAGYRVRGVWCVARVSV